MLNEKKLTTNQRKRLSASDFGVPKLRAFPLNDKAHVIQAIRMFNNVDPKHESTLAGNLIKAIKRFNLDVTIGENNRFKKYYESSGERKASSLLESVISGCSVRSLILEDSADLKFESNAKKYKDYLKNHYRFVKTVDLEIDQYTSYVSDFFITVYTSLSEIAPEDSVFEYDLEKVVAKTITHFGIGGPEMTDLETDDLARSVSNLFYADALQFDLVPVSEKKSYSIMTYSKESFYYHWESDSDYNLILRLAFYTAPDLSK